MASHLSRRHFLQMSGSLAAVGLLAACAPQAAAPQGEAAAEGGEGATSAGVNLIWDTFRGPGTGWNEERIETFKQDHPEVSIEFRPLTGSSQQDNYGKMYAMYAAGDLGDIIAFDPSHFHFWRAINAGIIGPLDDLVAADSLDLSQWYEQFVNLQYHQGKLYGLPSWGWAGHDTLVINKKHFDDAGIEVPDPVGHETSMETYGEWARSFYSEGERYGMAFSNSEPGVVVLTRIWNSDFINADGTQCLILEDENAQQALRWVYDLAVTDKVLPSPADVTDAAAAQLEGRVTMNWAGSLNVRNLKRDAKDPAVVEAWQGLFPTREDGKFPSQIRGGTWNMNAGTANPQAVYDFLKHITSYDGTIGFNLVAGQGALVRPDVLTELTNQDPVHEWFKTNLENGIPAHAPANSRGREYTDAITQQIQILLDPNQPVPFEEGLEQFHKAVQDVLDMDPA